MKKYLLVLFAALVSYGVNAQTGSANTAKTSLSNQPALAPDADFMFKVVMVKEDGFPTEAFDLANADHFIGTVQNWIQSDLGRYQQKLVENNAAGHYVLTRHVYKQMAAVDQEQFKNWFNSLERFISMQKSVTGTDQKIYLLSEADFSKFQSFFKK